MSSPKGRRSSRIAPLSVTSSVTSVPGTSVDSSIGFSSGPGSTNVGPPPSTSPSCRPGRRHQSVGRYLGEPRFNRRPTATGAAGTHPLVQARGVPSPARWHPGRRRSGRYHRRARARLPIPIQQRMAQRVADLTRRRDSPNQAREHKLIPADSQRPMRCTRMQHGSPVLGDLLGAQRHRTVSRMRDQSIQRR
jgi:hypothetical protein